MTILTLTDTSSTLSEGVAHDRMDSEEFHHVEEDFLPVPPSTPLLQQDSDPTERHTLYAPNSGPAQPLTVADPIALEMMMMAEMTDDMDRGRMAPSEPETETKAPPNSPMGTFKLGMDKHMRKSVLVRTTTRRREPHAYRYVSLVAASVAIMENRV
ncbi:hypothetical protein CPB84DRAFT_1842165 [Gymnopilus junonius]|uniref:Uncharacterized protein n=1 Tax=Gymnopilus junonius TaxID=109634 RepID=A0A9P5P154_GYMJU|nr:hypothetical protein CPB84DRAFT_1842165 [Gymnopilus junonius]